MKSRKLILTYIEIALIVAIPLAYQKYGVSHETQMLVVSLIAMAGGFYKGANVLEKKIMGDQNGQNKEPAD